MRKLFPSIGSVNVFPFNKNAKIGRATILNLIKIGRGMVLRMNLNIFFIYFAKFHKGDTKYHDGVLINRLMLFLKIVEL